MEKNVVTIYKKIKIIEDLYLYKFKEIATNVEYDFIDNTISYTKNNKKMTIYEMEDPAFTVSDEKMCFSDYIAIEDLEKMYNKTDYQELLDIYKKEVQCFIRIGYFDAENDILKIVNSDVLEIEAAEPDISFNEYVLTGMSDWTSEVTFPIETIEAMIKELESKQYESLKERLKIMINENNIITSGFQKNSQDNSVAKKKVEIVKKEEKKETLDDVMNELNSLIGLNEIKTEIDKLKKYLNFRKNTEDKIVLSEPNLNIVFSGNPGTGKTTVARLLARIYYLLGYAKTDKFKETTAQDFIAGYVGQTAIKARELIDQNKNGVIFIDEAYVFSSAAQQFADEALVEIIKEMESRNTIFIFSGYTKEMENFIKMNPGIRSRIGYNMEFKDYSTEELYEIFATKVKKAKLIVSPKAKEKIVKIIEQNKKLESFGNGRFIDNLFDKIIINHSFKINDYTSVRKLKTITSDTIDDELINSLKTKQKVNRIGY